MNIAQRVKYALIGFNSLFIDAVEYSFDNIVASAVQFSLEEHGITATGDADLSKLVMLRACIIALGPIETIMLRMPSRRRMEVGVETENRDVEKNLAALKLSYEKSYDKVLDRVKNVNTFTIFNGIPAQGKIVYQLIDFPSILQ